MNALYRLCVSLGILAAVFAGTRPVRLDELAKYLRILEQERQRREDLDHFGQTLLRRIPVKSRIAQEVIAGKLTLREAAVRFRALSERPSYLHTTSPNASEGECRCREVISWVRIELWARSPAEAEAAAGRLEEELATLLSEGGEIRLHDD